MDYAYQFVIDNHGIDTEEDYPFQGRGTSCNKAKVSVTNLQLLIYYAYLLLMGSLHSIVNLIKIYVSVKKACCDN